jgi:hypothetical protein
MKNLARWICRPSPRLRPDLAEARRAEAGWSPNRVRAWTGASQAALLAAKTCSCFEGS